MPVNFPRNDPSESPLDKRRGLDFELLYLIENEPGLTQREIAERLGISLGRVNYCLKALLEKGALKLANFRSATNKLGYAYVLTPRGIAERMTLTTRFLNRKLAEYERLKTQIETLQREVAHDAKRSGDADIADPGCN